MPTDTSLLKFQIGPVQDFIVQARSTRDLWSGSYLLSWLVAAGIRELIERGGVMIFPAKEDQPLLELEKWKLKDDHAALLTPNLPNLFVGRVEKDAGEVAKDVEKAIRDEWDAIAVAVWEKRREFDLSDSAQERFFAQVKRHLSISWQVTPETGKYRDDYEANGRSLDAVRQTRDFVAWDSAKGGTEKDSLSGREEAVMRGTTGRTGLYRSLFKHEDYLGAVGVIKRVWHLAYLKEKVQLRTFSNEFKIRSVPAIAARTAKHDDVEVAQEATTADKYIAAIAFDGDSIGAWLNGDRLPKDEGLAKHHENFSKALSNFALNEVIEIVMGTKAEKDEGKFKGQLIYAGGDDVIALVPADAALEIAAALRTAFRLSTKGTPSTGEKPDASAGIAIAHIRSPLQDLIREAKQAEKDAKNKVGRPAFSVTLMKRSGEISKWGGKWSDVKVRSEDKDKPDTAITHTLYHEIDNLVMTGRLSARFPHRICGLLASYLTARTGISKLEDDIIDSDRMVCLIHLEFHYAAVRQGSKEVAEQLDPHLKSYLDGIVANFVPPSDDSKPALNQVMLQSVIGLCTTLAFARRSVTTESLLATAP